MEGVLGSGGLKRGAQGEYTPFHHQRKENCRNSVLHYPYTRNFNMFLTIVRENESSKQWQIQRWGTLTGKFHEQFFHLAPLGGFQSIFGVYAPSLSKILDPPLLRKITRIGVHLKQSKWFKYIKKEWIGGVKLRKLVRIPFLL